MNFSKKIITVLLFLITIGTFAQQGINYKALIKDGSGNVVANQNITVQFIIYKGAALTNNVYQETHLPTTDANGIIIINIGKGSIDSGVFADIDWGSDEHHLNVQIDTGGGLTDLGTIQFMAVPYALQAGTATIASNVTGLETLDEGNGIGWRLVGRDPANYGNIGIDATDLSYSGTASSTRGATGQYSTAMGLGTTASGYVSTAMGLGTTASGSRSTAMGDNTTASGYASTAIGRSTTASGYASTAIGQSTTASGIYSTAMGNGTFATGSFSTAMGRGTTASSFTSTAIGRYNIGGGNATTWVATDNLFEIGNGADSANKSNAFTVLKNGTITAPSFDISEITDDKALITKEYADTNYNPTGLEAIDEGNGIGWRLVGRDPANYGNIGLNATDLSYSGTASSTKGATRERSIAMGANTTASGYISTAIGANTTALGLISTAMGGSTTASGEYSTAMGNSTSSSGDYSTAMGESTTASGDFSTAMGSITTASGTYSTAMGYLTTASGNRSTAIGQATKAEAHTSLAIGRFNIGGGNATTWVATDNLFEIGNGSSNANKSNAFTVLKNGTITAPSFDISEITDDKALITKEYAELNFNANSINDLTDGKSPVGDTSLFLGVDAGLNDDGTTNENVGVGLKALINNTTGRRNTAMGYQALYTNIAGDFNTALGTDALYTSNANYNTAIGRSALYFNTSGTNNTATGYQALNNNSTGSYNAAFGRGALSSLTTGTNNTAIGYNAQVPSNTGSNQIRIGNTAVTSATTQVAWTFPSDIRWKEQVRALPYGLDVLKQLKPVDYIRKNNDDRTRDMGFIAQDVEALLAKVGYKDQGFLTKDDNGYLSIRYNDFIALLTKAIQEQQDIIESQNSEIQSLTSELVENKEENTVQNKNIKQLLKRMQQIENLLNN